MPIRKKKSCNIRDLAKHLNLSICTVSRVLNGKAEHFKISAATQKLVREAAERLDYVPNVNAKRIFSGRSNVIGMLMPTRQGMGGKSVFSDTHFSGMMGGIEDALALSDYHVLLLYNQEEYRESGNYRKLFTAGLIDGLMIWGVRREERYWNALVELNFPRIFINTAPEADADANFSYVIADYLPAGEFAMDQLLAKGCRRILCLMGSPAISITGMTMEGVEKSLKKHGAPRETLLAIPSGYEESDGAEAVRPFLRDWKFDGVLCASLGAANGVAAQLHGIGCQVPVQIITTSEYDFRNQKVKQTVCIPDDHEIGRLAALSLLELIEGKEHHSPIQRVVPCRIINKKGEWIQQK